MSAHAAEGSRLLVYEPRVEGHHPGWLRFITEDLLAGGYELTLALDLRPKSAPIIEESLRGMQSRVRLISALDEQGGRRGGSTTASLRRCLEESGAGRAFLCEFDELASAMFRRAALGALPPAKLKGRCGGIYHRPRFMAAPRWSFNRWLKQTGFRKLLRGGWINPILFLDEYLTRDRQTEFPGAPLSFLPNPCPEGYQGDPLEARRVLGVPADRTVFLFYGGGYRRKGLHLAVEAALHAGGPAKPFLLCAGRLNPEGETARGLGALVDRGDAVLMNRYVTNEEEQHCFVAADLVLLPYLNHFGISAVLAQAVAAGRPVIASDEQLLGRQVRDNGLGLLFRSGDAGALGTAMMKAMTLETEERERFRDAARRYSASHSRAAYRQALLDSLRPQ